MAFRCGPGYLLHCGNRDRIVLAHRANVQGQTLNTPPTLPPDDRRLLESVVTLIQVHVAKAQGKTFMVQTQLPNMPRPVEPSFRKFPEYQLIPVSAIKNGFGLICSDDPETVLAHILMPNDEHAEARTMLVLAMIETFNAVQGEINA